MKKAIRKQCCGYEYTLEDCYWFVTTDYPNGKIYLNGPTDDEDLESIRQYGIAIGRAVADMKKGMGNG